ncbi:MAG: hypothetical protein CL489_08225 [Acidobacteria bacterium]|nr:hypothetical protein [Acidobacteriota bacterium]|tara:strand:+ start:7151 stop:7591 length:441 start_codon:yes stop_codon:yes gene_type:complete
MDYDVIRKVIENSSDATAIYVGCDSKRKKKKLIYVTTVVVHYDSNRGATVFVDKQVERYIGVFPKLQGEIYKAAEVAKEIKTMVGTRKFEVHLDFNHNIKYQSNKLIPEAKGAIMGIVGVEPKFKPDAWAASTCADKYTVNGGMVK